MDLLPSELLITILRYAVVALHHDKNKLLQLRTTCKAFDAILKPFALCTLQLEWTRLDKTERTLRPPPDDALERIGHLCQALYVDLMAVRDEAEVQHINSIFSQLPELQHALAAVNDRHCLNEDSFTELDFRSHLGNMLAHTPNATAVSLTLPTQLHATSTANTMLLGNVFDALARRPEEALALKTLAVTRLTDTTVMKLMRNPQDVKNIMDVFQDLETLALALHVSSHIWAHGFGDLLWAMICMARSLSRICLTGPWPGASPSNIMLSTLDDFAIWFSLKMPLCMYPWTTQLPPIACLELCSVRVLPEELRFLLQSTRGTLKELYLDGVYLKQIRVYSATKPSCCHWIGIPNTRPDEDHTWFAVLIRELRLDLRVCRVSNLGYDVYSFSEHAQQPPYTFDTEDPCGLGRSLEDRFVEVCSGLRQPDDPDGNPVAYLPAEESSTWAYADKERRRAAPAAEDQASRSLERGAPRDPPSSLTRAIDGRFRNRNPTTLSRLASFVDTTFEAIQVVRRAAPDLLQAPMGED
ncbi:hypothetical protein F4778DRAFT_756453 [Xylariomycetidae sp. FL2044]|nr:hypothetical protein F4778DRAFT_756453 [Xylariomycetidae sp. FL2044]